MYFNKMLTFCSGRYAINTYEKRQQDSYQKRQSERYKRAGQNPDATRQDEREGSGRKEIFPEIKAQKQDY